MPLFQLIKRNLVYFRRTHAGIVFGSMMATAVLTGALIIGDSMRYSLRQMSLRRLGRTHLALSSGDRFFDRSLAGSLADSLQIPVTSLLQMQGLVRSSDGAVQANPVQIYGITESFVPFAETSFDMLHLKPDEAFINTRLADKLRLQRGDTFLVRIEKSGIPGEVPLTDPETRTTAMRLTVKDILTSDHLGDFSLRISQIPPYNLFMAQDRLLGILEKQNDANVILFGEESGRIPDEKTIWETFEKIWKPSDSGLHLRLLSPQRMLELSSDRLFIDNAVSEAVLAAGRESMGVLTYFVNKISAGDRITPYSFVTAISASFSESEGPDAMHVSSWLARDLDLIPGDSVSLTYFIADNHNRLSTDSSRFCVTSVLSESDNFPDETLMPQIPGLSDAENCRDWDPGIPIDLDRIRPKDEAFWAQYKGTPKAVIPLKEGQKIWKNRFGNLTAVRYPLTMNPPDSVLLRLRETLNPSQFGFQLLPVRLEALQAGAQGVDFGQLFLGLGFFVIVSALLLIGLFFTFTVEQRGWEIGLFRALGYTPGMIRRIMLTEGSVLILLGSLPGAGLGLLMTQWILQALGTIWRGAVQTSGFEMQVSYSTMAVGVLAGTGMAVLTLLLTLRMISRQSIVGLQQRQWNDKPLRSTHIQKIISGLFLVSLAAALFLIINALAVPGKPPAGLFFGSGSLFLISGMALIYRMMIRRPAALFTKFSFFRLAVNNLMRRRGRTLTAISLLACSLFIVIGVGANRHGPSEYSLDVGSGTGGYRYWGESSLPIKMNLNSPEGRSALGLDASSGPVQFLQCRVGEGDDASCLNLNRIQRPRILGVDNQQLHARRSFSFAGLGRGIDPAAPWLALSRDDNGVIPAFADQTVILWGLGKQIGDTLAYKDEQGHSLILRLAGGLQNSVFQGNIVIAESQFLNHYPSVNGYRVFLIDMPDKNHEETAALINRRFRDYGLDLTDTVSRLSGFAEVENTYLAIFLALGGFGLLLGSIGLGIVVMRNVLERRGELALLSALGFRSDQIDRLVFIEHSLLLLTGLLLGFIAAMTASIPSFMARSIWPFGTVLFIMGLLLVSGLLWVLTAVRISLRKHELCGLRDE